MSWRLCLWVSAALLGHSESGACGCFGGSAPGGLLQPQPPWCAHSSCPAGLEGWRAVAGGTLTARSRQGARRALVMPSFPKAPFLFWSSFQRTGERQRQRSPHPSPPPPLTSARPALPGRVLLGVLPCPRAHAGCQVKGGLRSLQVSPVCALLSPALFLMALTAMRSIGRILCRRPSHLGFFDLFVMR